MICFVNGGNGDRDKADATLGKEVEGRREWGLPLMVIALTSGTLAAVGQKS